MARICQTVTAATMAELRRKRDAVRDADLVELRLDGVADVDVAGALADRRLPVVVTCRAAWEGGRFDGAEETRLALLAQAIDLGAEFVDVEWRADRGAIGTNPRTRLVLSHHDFSGCPDDLAARAQAMRGDDPAAIVKLAVTVSSLGDVMRLQRDTDVGDRIVIGMGTPGEVTRICPWLFGAEWTFAGDAAPGQISAAVLNRQYRVRDGSSSTRLYAITGAPLAHSASPAMHNAAFGALGIDAVYVPMATADAREFLVCAETLGVNGASVTAPLKTAWASCGVELDEIARLAGAANTLSRSPDGWEATNFDLAGFIAPLAERVVPLHDADCVILGAGGAARAAALALKSSGARVRISARRQERAAELAVELGVSSTPWPPAPGWDLLVNATPAGTWPNDESPIARDSLRGSRVYDLVYHPRETRLLRWARELGIPTIDGLEMLVAQARRQFERWTGVEAPTAVMQTAAETFLKTHGHSL
ncbi:MAG TPA: type I 3-dehydroquinate dehydratase [Vicinamibacterales bacterium]|nr:type I 3-dehydroquinate dehydratase [Vicinamibacterales bacterium]